MANEDEYEDIQFTNPEDDWKEYKELIDAIRAKNPDNQVYDVESGTWLIVPASDRMAPIFVPIIDGYSRVLVLKPLNRKEDDK